MKVEPIVDSKGNLRIRQYTDKLCGILLKKDILKIAKKMKLSNANTTKTKKELCASIKNKIRPKKRVFTSEKPKLKPRSPMPLAKLLEKNARSLKI